MKISRSVLLAAFTLLLTIPALAQEEKESEKQTEKQKGYDPTNWFTGGSISLGYGGGNSVSTFIGGLHPHFGYTLAKWLDVAAVVNFEYQSQKDRYYNYKVRNTTYGVGIFTRIYPVHFLFIQAQPEFNFIAQKVIYNTGPTLKDKFDAPSLLIGGGYTTNRMDKNSFAYVSLLVDIGKNINSPYLDSDGDIVPIIRAGYNIGLNRGKRK